MEAKWSQFLDKENLLESMVNVTFWNRTFKVQKCRCLLLILCCVVVEVQGTETIRDDSRNLSSMVQSGGCSGEFKGTS